MSTAPLTAFHHGIRTDDTAQQMNCYSHPASNVIIWDNQQCNTTYGLSVKGKHETDYHQECGLTFCVILDPWHLTSWLKYCCNSQPGQSMKSYWIASSRKNILSVCHRMRLVDTL